MVPPPPPRRARAGYGSEFNDNLRHADFTANPNGRVELIDKFEAACDTADDENRIFFDEFQKDQGAVAVKLVKIMRSNTCSHKNGKREGGPKHLRPVRANGVKDGAATGEPVRLGSSDGAFTKASERTMRMPMSKQQFESFITEASVFTVKISACNFKFACQSDFMPMVRAAAPRCPMRSTTPASPSLLYPLPLPSRPHSPPHARRRAD